MKAATLAATLTLLLLAYPASAQTKCSQANLQAVITDMSGKLRKVNVDSRARLGDRLRELAKIRGWSEAETEEKGIDLLEDDEAKVQDETASHLLSQVDQLGQAPDGGEPTCAQIEELKTVAAQLLEVTTAKAAHVSARLDAELKASRPATAAKPAAPPQQSASPKAEKKVAAAAPAEAKPAAPPATQQQNKQTWETQTSSAAKPNDAYIPLPPGSGSAPMPPQARVPEADLRFSYDDIRAAGRGFFGSISAELAGVIEYVFKSYGQPTGYILGTEGGAALLAGLRYGEGKLVTKLDGERKIFWQGPSVGYDFGLTGSRTMILIYGLDEPDQMLQRFGGIDGSAYLVGGAGVTILKKGPVILAPIRTGLGLRIGANVGYLKFTAKPRFNPL